MKFGSLNTLIFGFNNTFHLSGNRCIPSIDSNLLRPLIICPELLSKSVFKRTKQGEYEGCFHILIFLLNLINWLGNLLKQTYRLPRKFGFFLDSEFKMTKSNGIISIKFVGWMLSDGIFYDFLFTLVQVLATLICVRLHVKADSSFIYVNSHNIFVSRQSWLGS